MPTESAARSRILVGFRGSLLASPHTHIARLCGRSNPGVPMAFAEAVNRRLKKKICLDCGVTNAPRADRCRKCHSKALRVKALEARGGTAA